MELINWSLNAIDQIFSTRKAGSGEPPCPDGTYPAGYMRDSYDKWQVVCLAVLSTEDIEDVIIFGVMITGFLLIGVSNALVYRKIGKTAALEGAPRLPVMMIELSKAVAAQSGAINELRRMLASNSGNNTELANRMDLILERLSQADRKRDVILDKLQDLQSEMACLKDQMDKMRTR